MSIDLKSELLALEGATFEVEELTDAVTADNAAANWCSSSCSCSSCCSCSTSSCCSTSTSTT